MRSRTRRGLYWMIGFLAFIALLVLLRMVLPESWLRGLEELGSLVGDAGTVDSAALLT